MHHHIQLWLKWVLANIFCLSWPGTVILPTLAGVSYQHPTLTYFVNRYLLMPSVYMTSSGSGKRVMSKSKITPGVSILE
jgi:hypothetical protein